MATLIGCSPLRFWIVFRLLMIAVAREIRFALDRLKYLDPEGICLTINLNPPLGSMAILKALEIQLPKAYATFLLEVGNGGYWDCAERDAP